MDWVLIGEISDKFGVRYTLWELASDTRTMYEANVIGWGRGQSVGQIVLYGDTQSISVTSGFRRRGIASAMVDAIEVRIGRKLKPGAHLTKAGKAFWEARLERKNNGND